MPLDCPPPLTWTVAQTARAIGITERHLRNLIAKGEGPGSVRLGRRVVYLPETVRQWLRARERSAA